MPGVCKRARDQIPGTDALYKVYDEQERTRKTAAVVAATGAAGTAALGIFDAVEQNIHLLPAPIAFTSAAAIASSAIWYRARKEARWDQAAARAIKLDTTRPDEETRGRAQLILLAALTAGFTPHKLDGLLSEGRTLADSLAAADC